MTECRCFKCGAAYESDNPDDIAGDGYCPPCFEIKTAIAKELDAKMGPRKPEKPKPELPFKVVALSDGTQIKNYSDPATDRALGRI